jgi:hypothetical protein
MLSRINDGSLIASHRIASRLSYHSFGTPQNFLKQTTYRTNTCINDDHDNNDNAGNESHHIEYGPMVLFDVFVLTSLVVGKRIRVN